MIKRIIIITVLVFGAYGLLNYAQDEEEHGHKIFTDIADTIGLKDLPIDEGQIAWGDYNNDGYLDLYTSNGSRILQNSGPPDWKFTDVTAKVELKGDGGGGSWCDYDNDGNLDLLIFGGKETLWRNTGKPKFTFVNVADKAGDISDEFQTTGACWIDYDRDGYNDLYLVNYQNDKANFPDRLIKSEKGKFTDVTDKMGLGKEKQKPQPGRSAAIGDYNNDGWLDIYVSNYRLRPNYLWENQQGKSFKDVAEEKGVIGIMRQGYYGHTIASVFGDINNDGLLDLVVGNFAHKDQQRGPICDDAKIYINLGPKSEPPYKFEDIREKSGIPIKEVGGEEETIVGSMLADFDNDGLMDLYFTQLYDQLPYAYNYLYQNKKTDEGTTLTDITEDAGVRIWDSYICTAADYDNDGDLDLVVGGKVVPDEKAPHFIRFFRNEVGNKKNWIEVKLQGKHCNRSAIGAKVTVNYGKETQIREIGTATSNTSYNPFTAHFGLGDIKKIDSLEIRWPCGKVKKIQNPAINKIHSIDE